MREVLFRGKRLDNGEWFEGYLCKKFSQQSPHDKLAIQYRTTNDGWIWGPYYTEAHVDPATVGQYTGMRDSNGKQIFEGDILFFDYIGEHLGVRGKAAVVFQDGKFGVLWGYRKELVALDGFANVTVEVVGNIHDNPELLEGGD